MVTSGLFILVLIVFIAGSWSGYNLGYKAGILSDIQRHLQHNHRS